MSFHWPSAHNRLFEWVMALTMIGVAVTLAMPGDTLERSALRHVAGIGLTEDVIGTVFAIFGCARIAALIANGSSKSYGPWARAAAAFVSMFIWGEFTLVLISDAIEVGRPALSTPLFGALIFGELIVIFRAGQDGSRSYRSV